MPSMAGRLVLIVALVAIVAVSGATLLADAGATPNDDPKMVKERDPRVLPAGKFFPCPWPPCMGPCQFPPPPQGVCKSADGQKQVTSFFCCCCGGGGSGNKFRFL